MSADEVDEKKGADGPHRAPLGGLVREVTARTAAGRTTRREKRALLRPSIYDRGEGGGWRDEGEGKGCEVGRKGEARWAFERTTHNSHSQARSRT